LAPIIGQSIIGAPLVTQYITETEQCHIYSAVHINNAKLVVICLTPAATNYVNCYFAVFFYFQLSLFPSLLGLLSLP